MKPTIGIGTILAGQTVAAIVNDENGPAVILSNGVRLILKDAASIIK